jgi:superoxide dismutase
LTTSDESQTLAFNYARLTLNNSFFLHHRVRIQPPSKNLPSHLIRNHQKAPTQNHESALTEKPLNPERTQTLGAIIAAQLGTLTDLKIYVAAAAQGMQSGGGAGGFVWLVTDALGRLCVVATYGAGTLLVAERGQSLAPDGVELGGIYKPASPIPPNQFPPSSSLSLTGRMPTQARALSTSARASA